MQREEKQQEAILDAIIMRVNEIKNSIGHMIMILETQYESINWPSFLDNFALLSSHLTGLSKILQVEMGPQLRSLTVLPLMLIQDRDDDLCKLTENRVPTFSHDLVPNMLRTKPEPSAELKMLQLEQKAASLNYDTAQKQVAQYTKVVTHIWEIVNKAREEWEVEASARGGAQQTSSVADTNTLVAAVGLGKGLKMNMGGNGTSVSPAPGPGMMVNAPGRSNAPITNQQPQMVMGKAPSAIKTNIKSASQVHPYGR
uniref:Mediator of RNA polymerase II transcription subunit 8 n=1 Tax=Xenopsylla cheopis TaxID=163159 RepID=A0A6M2DS69_XENCH